MSYQLPPWLWPAGVVIVCALAVWRGRDDERLAAAGNLMAWAFSRLLFQAKTELTQWPILAVDVVFLALLTWIGMRSRRFWPLFAAGFQLLGVVSHLARAADPRVTGWAYLTAELAFSYMVLITLGYASWTAPARYAVTSDPVAEPGATLR